MRIDEIIFETHDIHDLRSHIKDLLPTPSFKKIHGHYCGPGNEGGEPIDGIDSLCQLHDVCYLMYGRDDVECDEDLIQWVTSMDTTKLTIKQKIARWAIIKYFEHKLARKTNGAGLQIQ